MDSFLIPAEIPWPITGTLLHEIDMGGIVLI